MYDDVDHSTRSAATAAALGTRPFDLLLTGGTVVDVGLGELRPADVGIVGGLIASVHETGARADAERSLDVTGRFVAPGFMDLHVHFESSMLTPRGYAEAVLPRGTTTVFADPHELGNVVGLDGVRYAVEASRGLPLRFLFQAPSCVPPMPGLELSGADFGGDEVAEMLSWATIDGVAEVMDNLGVLAGSPRMVEVVEAGIASGKLVSGHAMGLAGAPLQGYMCAGVTSDHEVMSLDDVQERLALGMTVELRGALEIIVPPIAEWLAGRREMPPHLVTCTDDVFAEHLIDVGGIDQLLRMLISFGVRPVDAIRLATLNCAYRLGRGDLGLVGPGRLADLVVLDDLDGIAVNEVISGGTLVAAGGDMLVELTDPPATPPLDTVKLAGVTPSDMALRLPGIPDGRVRLRTVEGVLLCGWGEVEADVVDGVVVVPDDKLLQVAIHRHGRAEARPVAGLVGGWGKWRGAIATTVAHDTHNLVVFGRDPVDMAAAANAVIAAGGGVAVATGGEVTAIVELPIAGLLSPLPAIEVAEAQKALEAAALEVAEFTPLLPKPLFQVMAASLACLPGPHITDVGLVDGTTGELVTDLVLG